MWHGVMWVGSRMAGRVLLLSRMFLGISLVQKSFIIFLLFIGSVLFANDTASAKVVIHSKTAVAIELVGFNSLAETTLFKGNLQVDGNHEVKIPYKGLGLLVFPQGQSYPIIIGKEAFTVNITPPLQSRLHLLTVQKTISFTRR